MDQRTVPVWRRMAAAGDAERDEGLFSFRVPLPPWPTGWLALESLLSDWKDCGARHVGMVSLERTGEEDPVGQPQSDSDYYEAILAGAGRLAVELEGTRPDRLDALIAGHPFVHDFCLRLVSLQCDHIGSAPHHLPACGDFRT